MCELWYLQELNYTRFILLAMSTQEVSQSTTTFVCVCVFVCISGPVYDP